MNCTPAQGFATGSQDHPKMPNTDRFCFRSRLRNLFESLSPVLCIPVLIPPLLFSVQGEAFAQETTPSLQDSSSVETSLSPLQAEDTSFVPSPFDTTELLPDTLELVEFEDSIGYPVELIEAEVVPGGQYSLSEKIYGERLEGARARDLSGLLAQSSNVDIFTYGPYGSPTSFEVLNIPPLGTEIVVDGIPFRSPGLFLPFYDGVDLNNILIENLDTLKVLYGGMASTSAWGSPVVLVKLDSKRYESLPSDSTEEEASLSLPRSRVRVERGPYKYHRSQIELGSRIFGKLDYFLAMGIRKSSGYLLTNELDGLYISGRFSYPLRRNLLLDLNFLRQRIRRGFPLFDYWVTQNPRKTQEVSALGFGSKYLWSGNKSLFLKGYYLYQPQTLKDLSLGIHDKYEDRGWGARAGIDFVWEEQRFLIEVGSRREGLKINQRPEESSLESWFGFTNEIRFSDKLRLLGAARVLNHNSYDNFFLPTLGLSFCPGDGYEIYSSVFRRVTCPSLYHLYWPPESYSGGFTLLGVYDYTELGNPDLRPQVWWGADWGFQFAKERFDLSWYLLYANIDDLILWSNQGLTFDVFHQPVNTFATLWGTNLSGNLKPRKDIHLHLAYTYKSLRTDEIPSPEVTPLHTILGWAELERSFLGGDLTLKGRMEGRYSSDRYLLGFREVYQPSVFVLRYSLQFRYLDFCFYYQSENLTNREYLTWGYNPMPLRTNWWGIRWDFRD